MLTIHFHKNWKKSVNYGRLVISPCPDVSNVSTKRYLVLDIIFQLDLFKNVHFEILYQTVDDFIFWALTS